MTQLEKNKTYILDEFLLYVKEEERAERYEGIPVFIAPVAFSIDDILSFLD